MRTEKELEGVTLLGNQGTVYPNDYNPSLLETFENKHRGRDYVVTFDCPEFTTLCPKTGQPDFGHIYIKYIPRTRMVESKSLPRGLCQHHSQRPLGTNGPQIH